MPRSPAALLKRSLIFVHRWFGIALSVIFTFWFASGIVMMYWSFPGVTDRDRLERLPELSSDRIKVPVEKAIATAGVDPATMQVRLTSVDGRPAYCFNPSDRRGAAAQTVPATTIVFADDGTRRDQVDAAMLDGAAAAWARHEIADAKKESVEEVDQWTVSGELRTLRPLWKYSFPDGQQVYVDGSTAAVVQYTTASTRFWAYLGAIPHWLYFTPLRKHQSHWFSVVVFSSIVGTLTAMCGLVIGLWMFSPRRRYRYAGAATSIPYRGWKRLHAMFGLVFGLATTTWVFSGLLSMGPFAITDRLIQLTVPGLGAAADRTSHDDRRSFAATLGSGLLDRDASRLEEFKDKDVAAALASVRDLAPRQIEYASFAGEPLYLATNEHGETRIVPVRGEPRPSFTAQEIMDAMRQVGGADLADLRVMTEYDAYYLDRLHRAPLPVVFAQLNDPVKTRLYIDLKTAGVVGTYSARHWVDRWLYHGLHSLDFPWLYQYRPLWDIVVITLMLGGMALCMTSLVLATRVLRRKLAALARAPVTPPDEDLAIEL